MTKKAVDLARTAPMYDQGTQADGSIPNASQMGEEPPNAPNGSELEDEELMPLESAEADIHTFEPWRRKHLKEEKEGYVAFTQAFSSYYLFTLGEQKIKQGKRPLNFDEFVAMLCLPSMEGTEPTLMNPVQLRHSSFEGYTLVVL